MVEGHPWPLNSEALGIALTAQAPFLGCPYKLQQAAWAHSLSPHKPPGLRHSHALGLMQCQTYKSVGAFSFPQKSTIHRLPHWQLQLSLAGYQLQVQLCMESKVLLVALADRLQKNTLSPWRFMYIGQRGCLYPSRHIQCLQGGTQHGDRPCTYPLRQQLACPGFPLIALRFLPSRSIFVLDS